MSGLVPIVTPLVNKGGIVQKAIDCPDCVSPFTLSITTFVLGSILMVLVAAYIIYYVFGKPALLAKAVTYGGSLIQHFETPKSATFKMSSIQGGAFRYADVRDGTVASPPGCVSNVGGRNIVLTFSQLGVAIPIYVLGGISALVSNGINNLRDLDTRYGYDEVITSEDRTQQAIVRRMYNPTIVSGYDFNDFRELSKQTNEEKIIPLTIEATPDFITKNISADYTEKKIKIDEQDNTDPNEPNPLLKVLPILFFDVILFMIGLAIK